MPGVRPTADGVSGRNAEFFVGCADETRREGVETIRMQACGSFSHPEGMKACSRWLSVATPPEMNMHGGAPRRRCWRARTCWRARREVYRHRRARSREALACLPACNPVFIAIRWCRYAQPPATGFHPCGMGCGSHCRHRPARVGSFGKDCTVFTGAPRSWAARAGFG
jgi:hypothetical protein